MTRTPRLYISDILESIEKIQRYTKNLTFEEFMKSPMVIDAVARNFEIIGEASSHVHENIQDQYPQLPWFKMKAMRNIVAHEYFRIDLSIMWETAQVDLPELLSPIQKILSELR
ncbi:MAG: DUF86 domain-containing protein [Syntrophomonas sp.]